jgi:hypothetical protein
MIDRDLVKEIVTEKVREKGQAFAFLSGEYLDVFLDVIIDSIMESMEEQRLMERK